MSDETVRDYIVAQLEPNLPDTWQVESGVPTIGTLAKPLLWIEYTSFEPLPEAPLSSIMVGADVCIATSLADLRKGEDDADEQVSALYEAAFAARSFYRITATKTVFADRYVGWRMSVVVVTTNPRPATPEPPAEPGEPEE